MLEPVTRPRFAVWQYEAPAIVLGCSQRKFEDGARARLGGAAELLLRPSGGGAVLISMVCSTSSTGGGLGGI